VTSIQKKVANQALSLLFQVLSQTALITTTSNNAHIITNMRSVRIPYFRIWYSSAFVTLFFAAFITTIVTPADLVYQNIRNNRNIPNIFSIAGVYVLTIVISLFIWASRIYTNRAILNAIPKAYIPVDAGEVPRRVHRMIVKQWERSAIVAWDSRPRDIREEMQHEEGSDRHERHAHPFRRRQHFKDKTIIPPEKALAAWGPISHPGWSSPASEDLPNLEYWRVFIEMPNLIEAKAVSIAPPGPTISQNGNLDPNASSAPDARIVALLQRPSAMTLRDYLDRLASFDLINPPHLAEDFLAQYEYARFSTSALTEPDFRALMATFASILTGMGPLDPTVVEAHLDERDSSSIFNSSSSSLASEIHHRLSTFSASGPSRPSSRYTYAHSSSSTREA
jgi:hypothetical protein